MGKIELNIPSPDFEIQDLNGENVILSSYKESKNVVLVFNRGFT